MSRRPPRATDGEVAPSERAGAPADLTSGRRRRPAPAPLPPREPPGGRAATPAEVAELRARLLQSAMSLPGVALDASRLDADAAGLFVRRSGDDGTDLEMREFATLRTHPRWRLSVVVPMAATAELQRLGWGRPRPPDGPGPLLLELTRPGTEADLGPLQQIIALAHRVAADGQGRNR
jgi:hypothetical protein